MNTNNKIKNIVLTAFFAGIICTAINFIPRIPTGFNGGYIHLGDTFIYLAAVLLPTPYAMLAAGIGAGLADTLAGGMLWVIPTIIIKPTMVLFFTSKSDKLLCKRNSIALVLAGFIGCFGYYLAGAIISGNFIAPLASLYLEIIQPIVNSIIFILVAYAFDKIKIKERIFEGIKQ